MYKRIFITTLLLLFTVVGFTQLEKTRFEFITQDDHNNISKQVMILQSEKNVNDQIDQIQLPKAIKSDLKASFKKDYQYGEEFEFVAEQNGKQYSVNISPSSFDDTDMPNRARIQTRKKMKRNTQIQPQRNMKLFDATNKFANTPFIGLEVEAFDYKSHNQLKAVRGVVIATIIEGETAYNAELEVGDIITKVNDLDTPSPSLFYDAIQQLTPRETVTFTYYRNNKKKTSSGLVGKKIVDNYIPFQLNELGELSDNFIDSEFFKHFNIDQLNEFFDNFNMDKPELGISINEGKHGVEVLSVKENSAAENAGLAIGDIITKIDKKTITTPEELVEVIRNKEIDDKVSITYQRDNKIHTTIATLKAMKQQFFFKQPQVELLEEKS